MSAMLRVRQEVRDQAAQLAETAGVSIGELVARALESYERELFWKKVQEEQLRGAYDEDEEHRLWEATLKDGLDEHDD